MNSKIKLGQIIQSVAVVSGVVLILIGLWLYGVEHYDPNTGLYFDGLGREISSSYQGISGRTLLQRCKGLVYRWRNNPDSKPAYRQIIVEIILKALRAPS